MKRSVPVPVPVGRAVAAHNADFVSFRFGFVGRDLRQGGSSGSVQIVARETVISSTVQCGGIIARQAMVVVRQTMIAGQYMDMLKKGEEGDDGNEEQEI